LQWSCHLLLLRNSCISLYQSLNFIWFPSNYSRFRTILFCVIVFDIVSASTASIFALNILLYAISIILVFSKASSSMILNDSNISSSTSIPVVFCLVLFVLSIQCLNYNTILKCYNLKLGLDYNLGKDLSKSEDDDQLVKHKNTGLYLQLYMPSNHEKRKRCQKREI